MKRFAKLAAFCALAAATFGVSSAAHAQETPIEQNDPATILEFPVEPQVTSSATVGAEGATGATANTDAAAEGDVVFSVDLGGDDGPRVPSQSVVLIILITLLSVAPALLIMMTSFTRVVIVFTLLRNALGLPTAPPNQVLVGLSLFISLFIMAPTLSEAWNEGVKPFTEGALEQSEAFDAAIEPFREFMSANVGTAELELMLGASQITEAPETIADVPLQALIPAFILSELKTAFLIGFIVFIPFLVIDLVTSASLMSLGMMMMPPPMVSLPLKLLLIVMVDGWSLVTSTLISGFNT